MNFKGGRFLIHYFRESSRGATRFGTTGRPRRRPAARKGRPRVAAEGTQHSLGHPAKPASGGSPGPALMLGREGPPPPQKKAQRGIHLLRGLRAVPALRFAPAVIIFFILFPREDALASFHLMRIRQVMAGAGGNGEIQFVELQMTSSGQTFVGGQKLEFFDAAGLKTGSFTIPSNVDGVASGSSILIGTQAFSDVSTAKPDFLLPGPMIEAPSGRVRFAGSAVDPSVSYGDYTASMMDGLFDYVAPAAALPIDGLKSLLRVRTATPFNNSTDYALGTPEFKNNKGDQGTVVLPTPPTCNLITIQGPAPAACQALGVDLQVDGSGSTGTAPLTFLFDVTPAAGASIADAQASSTTISFSQAGSYEIHLTVKNAAGQDTCGFAVCVEAPTGQNHFQRGDCNGDHAVDISDAISLLAFSFTGGTKPRCLEACDANGDDLKDLSDAVFILNFLFLDGPVIPPPYPACDVEQAVNCLQETCG